MKISDFKEVKALLSYYESLKLHLKNIQDGGEFSVLVNNLDIDYTEYWLRGSGMSKRFIADIQEAMKIEISFVESRLETLGVSIELGKEN